MIRKMKGFFKGVLLKMGLVKNIKSLSELKQIPADDEYYKHIEKWKALYQGYFSDWHDVKYNTIDGTKKRRMASLGMAKVVAQEMASLIFNERCEINISDKDLSSNISNVFEHNKFVKRFQDYLEFQFALGGMVIKPFVSDGQLKLSYVTADCFVPISWDNQGIHEAVFPNEIRKGKKKYTHLEWHLWEGKVYVIKHELFVSDNNDLGKKVPLSTLYPDLKEEARIEAFKRSNFVYFRPNVANNIDMHSPLGISLFANSLDTLKTLDIAFDSYQREFRLGKRRIIVPASAVRLTIDENGVPQRYFDADDEVYQAMGSGNSNTDDQKIHDSTVELRVEEHVAAINSMLNLLAMQTGFSAGAFTFDGKSMKTATEVVSENSKTFKSKQSHENIIEAGLTELIECIIQTAELYDLFDRPKEDWDVTVTFDDSIAEDRTAEINKQIKMIVGGVQSRKRAIMKVHGVTEDEAAAILQEIEKEQPELYPQMDKEAEDRLFKDME